MCGISGIYNYIKNQEVDRALLQKMTDALAHRGPDGEGLWCDGSIGLGHRRLAIQDLSERGAQPMQDNNSNFVITFNGEIYNFKELRSLLEKEGEIFNSQTDTEVILKGYARWGRDLLEKLNGMFAFAIWDKHKRELILARDPFGIKPLFYNCSAERFSFASEIKSIISDPNISRAIDISALDSFFTYSYMSAPQTGLQAVKQLLPGYCAIVNREGFKQFKYYTYPAAGRAQIQGLDEAGDIFAAKLHAAANSHMISDAPLGAFLSAGVDSAAVVLAMSRTGHSKVRAFTAAFRDTKFDESKQAALVAERIGVEHLIQESSIDPQKLLPEISKHLEDPFADSSSLAVYQICKAARQHVKVVLSGDGADELLGGYDTYAASNAARLYRLIPQHIRRRIINPLLKALPIEFSRRNSQNLIQRFLYAAELGAGNDHAAWRVIFREDLKDKTFAKSFRVNSLQNNPYKLYAESILDRGSSVNYQASLQKADTLFYLPNDMLVKMDRMSMAHGLEVRVPYLDRELAAFCISLPQKYKFKGYGQRKIVLKKYLKGHLPDEFIKRRKTGFNVPLAEWMKTELRPMFLDLLSAHSSTISQYFNIQELEKMMSLHCSGMKDYCHELFTVLMFLFWLHNLQVEWKS